MIRSQSGDTLVEVAIGIALMGIVVVVAFNLANSTFRLAAQAKERTQASHLAQDQAEKLRAIRDKLVASSTYKDDYTKVLVDDPAFPHAYNYINDDLTLRGQVADPDHGYQPLSFYHVTTKVAPSHTTTASGDATNGRLNATIDVTWDSVISNPNGNKNHMQITYTLADTRPAQPIDCSVVGSAVCQ